MIVAMIKNVFLLLQFNLLTPITLWKRVPGRRLRRHSEQANGSKGGDASQDLRPLCLQELEEGAYRHGELNHMVTPSLSLWKEEVVYVDNFF